MLPPARAFCGAILEPTAQRPARHPNRHLANVLRKAGGSLPFVLLHTTDDEDEAFLFEIMAIAFFGRSDCDLGPLCNATDGGEGPSGARYSRTAENRRKASTAQKAFRAAPENKERIAEGLRRGWAGDDERRARARETIAAWNATPEAKAILAARNAAAIARRLEREEERRVTKAAAPPRKVSNVSLDKKRQALRDYWASPAGLARKAKPRVKKGYAGVVAANKRRIHDAAARARSSEIGRRVSSDPEHMRRRREGYLAWAAANPDEVARHEMRDVAQAAGL